MPTIPQICTYSESPAPHFSSAGPTSDNLEQPTPFLQNTHPRRDFDEQVPMSHVQRSGVSSISPHRQSTSCYTGNFFSNQSSPPVPRLRPASWGSPSQVDEEFENHRITRSRSSIDLWGDQGGEDEGFLSARRAPPPGHIPHESWHSDVYTTSNASHNSPYESSPDSGHVSATGSIPIVPLPLNLPNDR